MASDMEFDSRKALSLYFSGEHEALSALFVDHLERLKGICIVKADQGVLGLINGFCQTLGYLFSQPDFVIQRDLASKLIVCNELIGNLFAMSAFKTSDAFLESILPASPTNIAKILTLYSPRNHLKLETRTFLDLDVHLTTIWYYNFSGATHAYLANRHTLERIQDHYNYLDPRLATLTIYVNHVYFAITYICPEMNARVKYHINNIVRNALGGAKITNVPNPDKKRIAILTDRWFPGHVVYRNYYRFIKELAQDYELILIGYSGAKSVDHHLDKSLFAEVRYFTVDGGAIALEAFQNNDFHAAIFVDVGMSLESIIAANLRIAPVQVVMNGHPVSTFGAEVDYLVGSGENYKPHDPDTEFSERLVLVPGLGTVPTPPNGKPRYVPRERSTVYINCPWTAQKTNYHHLMLLRKMQEQAKNKKIKFHFFPLLTITKNNAYWNYQKALMDIFGEEHAHVFRVQNEEYLQEMVYGDFMIESAPFGGFNSVLDTLYLSRPVLTLEGRYQYSRFGSRILARAGLEELITHTEEAFIAKGVQLIDDEDYRNALAFRIGQLDLFQMLYDQDESHYYKLAMDHLLTHHETLRKEPKRSPIFITPHAEKEKGPAEIAL